MARPLPPVLQSIGDACFGALDLLIEQQGAHAGTKQCPHAHRILLGLCLCTTNTRFGGDQGTRRECCTMHSQCSASGGLTHSRARNPAAGLSILMDVLGEVGEEEGGTLLEAAVMSQVHGGSLHSCQSFGCLFCARVPIDKACAPTVATPFHKQS